MTREEKLAAAGDYVLGLLDDPARAAFEADLPGDPELAAMVADLTVRMQALDATAAPEPVDPGLWAAIERRLDAAPRSAAVIPLRPRPAAPTFDRRSWMAIAASVVVAGGIGYLAGTITGEPQPVVIAVLLNADATPGAIIEAFADNSVHLVPLQDFAVPEGSILEVWTLPDPATGPVSLGTLPLARDSRLTGPALPLPQDGQLYEITLEPAPGSPTGRPTGPILAKGFAALPPS